MIVAYKHEFACYPELVPEQPTGITLLRERHLTTWTTAACYMPDLIELSRIKLPH